MLAELHWILPSRLAGSARPGLLGPLDDDLDHLARLGVDRVVSLTEAPLDLGGRTVPFEVIHFPIVDMGLPTPRGALALCNDLVASIAAGQSVLLHCKAGLGRTGTMLAACLVTLGHPAEEAIATVRRACPHYIQTPAQAAFLPHLETFAQTPQPVPAGLRQALQDRPWR